MRDTLFLLSVEAIVSIKKETEIFARAMSKCTHLSAKHSSSKCNQGEGIGKEKYKMEEWTSCGISKRV